jgi:hypothetical protein
MQWQDQRWPLSIFVGQLSGMATRPILFFTMDSLSQSGPATAAILLGELSNFRFKPDEMPSEVVLRLQELFD